MKLKRLLVLLTLPVVIVGCGGTGGGGGGGTNALASSFRMDFSRGVNNTTLVMFFDQAGNFGVQINDASQVEWVGQGKLIGTAVNATLSPVGTGITGNVTLNGILNQGSNPTITINLSGAVSESSTASQISGNDVTPFAGTYAGTYDGSENGTIAATISNTGIVGGTVNSPSNGNNLPVIGSVDITGAIHFRYHTSSGDAHYTGYVLLPSGSDTFRGSGTWSFGGSSGNWTAQQQLTP